MGLLIGASALTICEVLDLIIYNIIIKVVDKGRKMRSVGDVETEEEKKKPPSDNEQIPQTKQDYANMEPSDYQNMLMPPIEELLKDPLKLQYKDNVYNPYPSATNMRE